MQKNNSDNNEITIWDVTTGRRYDILRSFIILLACVSPFFTVINYLRGVYILAFLEIAVFIISLLMLYMLRERKRLRLISFIFIIISCLLGLAASGIPGTHPTVAVWNGLCPFMGFYLLGRRNGAILTIMFIPASTTLYMLNHGTGARAIPLVAVMNIGIFLLCISWIAYHFETTRAETEAALLDDINERKKTERELEKTVEELRQANSDVRTLSGLLPICASCKKIRDDRGYWTQIESYIRKHSDAEFSHGICPECAKKYYPDLFDDND